MLQISHYLIILVLEAADMFECLPSCINHKKVGRPINSQIQDKSIIFERLQITNFLLLLGQIRSLRSLTCIEDSPPCKTLVFSVFMFFAVLGCLIY